MTNLILKELHDIRKQILAEHGDDLALLACRIGADKSVGSPDREDQAENNPMHRSGEVGRIGSGESIVAAQ